MYTLSFLATSILLIILATTGCIHSYSQEALLKPSLITQKETPKMESTLSNPYTVADLALDAYRERNWDAYKKLLLNADTSHQAFAHADMLNKTDRIKSLFFQDDKGQKIAAIVRLRELEQKAIYFLIIRDSGRFLVKELYVADENPKMQLSVEGF